MCASPCVHKCAMPLRCSVCHGPADNRRVAGLVRAGVRGCYRAAAAVYPGRGVRVGACVRACVLYHPLVSVAPFKVL